MESFIEPGTSASAKITWVGKEAWWSKMPMPSLTPKI